MMAAIDMKSFAAGLAVGGRWNHTHGTLPMVQSSIPAGTYWHSLSCTLSFPVPGVTILYGLGVTPSTIYKGEQIYIPGTSDLYAFASLGQSLSAMARFRYVIDNPFETSEQLVPGMPRVQDAHELVVSALRIVAEDRLAPAMPGVSEGDIVIQI